MNSILKIYAKHPLKCILVLGFLVRCIAALFSKGYAFTDDHYFVIEEAQQWISLLNAEDSWVFPKINTPERLAHGSLYTYVHYLLFQGYAFIGFQDPMDVMFSVRFIHAIYSLFIVYLGYKITRKLSHHYLALNVAWLLALAWFMPFLSVRNLVEMVCIPPLMWATYLVLGEPVNYKKSLLAGILFSIAFALRFQTVLFSGIIGLLWLFQGKIKSAVFLFLGFLFGSLILLGFIDYKLFGTPFHDLISYIEYNATHSGEYPNGPWYQYILLLLGMFLLFSGGNWFTAIAKKGRNWPVLLFPILAFLIFHSYFPNKQERFILPIVPFFILLGSLSWEKWMQDDVVHPKIKNYHHKTNVFFWILNVPLLLILSLASTKTAKIDAMYRLYLEPKFEHFAVETSHKNNTEFMPRFYGNFWKPYQHIVSECPSNCYFDSVALGRHPFPDYVLFFDTQSLQQRIDALRFRSKATYIATIESSWLDRLIPKLNPIVKSQIIQIWKTEPLLPTSAGTASIETTPAAKSAESSRRATSTKSTTAKTTTEK